MTTSGTPATTRLASLAMTAAVGLAVFPLLALWATRFHLVPTSAGLWRGISDPPGLVGLIAAAAGAGLVAWRLAGTSAGAPLLGLALAAAPLVPVLTGRLHLLLAFQGRVLVVVAAAVLGAACAQVDPRPWLTRIRPGVATLFAVTFLAYALLGLRLPGAAGPQGDEPHYLVMAESLLRDGDLDLANEFRDREYASFFAGVLEPHTSPRTPRGRLYSIHTPGLPALILPGYALAGFRGAQLELSAIAALTVVVVFRLVAEQSASLGLGYLAWALLAFALPLPVYAVSIYPETIAALALAVFLWRATRANGWASLAAVSAIAVLLPWVHPKFLPLAAIGVALVVAQPGPRWARGLTAALPGLSLLALLAWFRATYGQASLSAAYGPGFSGDLSLLNVPRGLLGLLIDRQFGLLAVAPVFALALPGAMVLRRESGRTALQATVLAGAAVSVGASFSMWWGGSCPPARFMVPAMPVLAFFAALAFREWRVIGGALAGVSFAVLALAAEAPRALHNRPDGESGLLRLLAPALDLDRMLPSFLSVGEEGKAPHHPLLDQSLATLQLLAVWDPSAVWSATGLPAPATLAIPLDLQRAPWLLSPGQTRLSRRIELPPGLYRLFLRAEPLPATPGSGAVARIELRSDTLVLAAATFERGAVPPELVLPLPAGVRRLTLQVSSLAPLVVSEARVVPDVVVPRPKRGELTWPRVPQRDRYRVGRGLVKTTALDRSTPQGDGFVTDGAEGRLLVDAPPLAEVVVRVRRTHAKVTDALVWGTRRVPLGTSPEVVLRLPIDDGEPLGPLTVVSVRLEAQDAWMSCSDATP